MNIFDYVNVLARVWECVVSLFFLAYFIVLIKRGQ